MSYLNRPYESSYYEIDKEVIRKGPYDNYSDEYTIDEYGNHVPHHHHHHHKHHNSVGAVVSEIVSDVISGGHHHQRHSGPTEIIERREERIVDSSYDPYKRQYY